MAGPIVASGASADAEATRTKVWPSAGAAYWALAVIILATFMSFLDQVVFGMLAENIKRDFQLTDSQLGFLAGPATIICYFFVGIPLGRLADIYPRKLVLSVSAGFVGMLIALSGMAQNFTQFVGSRVFLAAGGSAHAPSSYSLLTDAFPPRVLTRAFALLQLGFIGGTTLGPIIGGRLVTASNGWAAEPFFGLTIFNWQWALLYLAIPSMIASLLFLTVREPQRLAPRSEDVHAPADASLGRKVITFMGFDAARAIHAGGKVYYPLFGALALSAIEAFGIMFWRTPYLMREFGWNPAQIGDLIGSVALIASIGGMVVGGAFVEWLAKRHKDANIRAAFICFCGSTIVILSALLIRDPYWSSIAFGCAAFFAIAGAVPQNAAIQRVAPNDMRGQVTAFYLFMFTFFGAMGSWFIGVISDHVTHNLGQAILATAFILMPTAAFLMYRAITPYREEVERLEALEKETAHV
ncbi:MAG: MFS transporter [Sphingomonadales bacterium]|nr:MFS transporter [Sphingomonadales bacterium]